MYNDLLTISSFIDILLMFIYESHSLLYFGLLERLTKDLRTIIEHDKKIKDTHLSF